jgi:esterase/lipase superfamily enzyme
VKKFGKFEQVTLYASNTDRALMASRAIYQRPRAGYANPPLVLEGLATVDVSAAGAEMFDLGHSYFATAKTVFNDLYYLLRLGLTPAERNSVTAAGGYYVLK